MTTPRLIFPDVRILLTCGFILLSCIQHLAQTNDVPPLKLFSLPAIKPGQLEPVTLPASSTIEPSEQGASSAFDVQFDAALGLSSERYRWMNGRDLLTRIEMPEESILNQALHQDVVRLKKVYFTGSIVTAFKRKNPLYLLHPLVFAAGW